MDAVDASPKSTSDNSARIRYGRDFIFSFKERVLSSDSDIFDNIDLNTIAQRAGRGKTSKQSSFGRGQTDRFRESKGIVLGPQKRTWNTGCHVSQTGSTDYSGRGRNGPDYRTGDRYSKGDTRREYRNGFRERGPNRRADNLFCGSHSDHRDRKHHRIEEEPEWFSGGPTTVTETIELGALLEADGECSRSSSKEHDTSVATLENSTDSKASFESSSPNRSSQDGLSQQPGDALKQGGSIHSESQGSRFKHLFASVENASVPKKENINEQLLRLLKGTAGPDAAKPDKNNVLQVENKLRSILLGRRASSGNEEASQNVPEKQVETTKVLTVEEIESQLNHPVSGIANGEQPVVTQSTTAFPENQNRQFTHSNLTSILQSLALKQPQNTCSRQSTVHPGALSSLGILSNSTVRLPPSTFRWLRAMTNAMSASARINQLHQPELFNPQVSNDSQGVLGKILENGPGLSCLSTAQVSNSYSQPRPIGLNTELTSKSGSLPVSMVNMSGLPATRRPIVKSQAGNHLYPVDGPNSNAPSQKYGSGLQDIDRQLFNMVAGQQSRASGDKVSYNHAFAGTCDEARVHGAQRFDSSIPIGSANNSNLYSTQAQSPYYHPTGPNNSFGFLSNFAETQNIKPKTLEEIERQEVFNTNTYF